jgi:hypothetical protein
VGFLSSSFSTYLLKTNMNGITAEERAKYGEIFQARGQMNGYMAGKRPVFKEWPRMRKKENRMI